MFPNNVPFYARSNIFGFYYGTGWHSEEKNVLSFVLSSSCLSLPLG